MRQTVVPGAKLDILTEEEARAMIRAEFEHEVENRLRADAIDTCDGTGALVLVVYEVPAAYELEVRRVFLDLDTAADPATGNVVLNAAGKVVEYRRSGTRIEYGLPQGSNGQIQVPGVQTWSRQQGPYLRNGERFEVAVKGMTANAKFTARMEGILSRPPRR